MIDCIPVKQFEAWHEAMHRYIVATMLECNDGSSKITPEGTRYTLDSENNIIWIVPLKEDK